MFFVQPAIENPELPSFSVIEDSLAVPENTEASPGLGPEEINVSASREWMQDTGRFVEELDYLMETNCSDHALRLYGQELADLDTSLFHPETGRLRDADGRILSKSGMRIVVNATPAMLPLAYMKDEHVPPNFTRIMQHIKRKKDWTTCKFKIHTLWRLQSGVN